PDASFQVLLNRNVAAMRWSVKLGVGISISEQRFTFSHSTFLNKSVSIGNSISTPQSSLSLIVLCGCILDGFKYILQKVSLVDVLLQNSTGNSHVECWEVVRPRVPASLMAPALYAINIEEENPHAIHPLVRSDDCREHDLQRLGLAIHLAGEQASLKTGEVPCSRDQTTFNKEIKRGIPSVGICITQVLVSAVGNPRRREFYSLKPGGRKAQGVVIEELTEGYTQSEEGLSLDDLAQKEVAGIGIVEGLAWSSIGPTMVDGEAYLLKTCPARVGLQAHGMAKHRISGIVVQAACMGE